VTLLFAAALALSTGGALSAAEGPPQSETGPYLTWELRSESIPGRAAGDHWWYQDAVVMHAPDGTVRWRRELPARCRDWQTGIGDAEAQGHRDYPRSILNLYFVIGMEWTDDAVAIADRTGVLALARADGAVLLDAPMTAASDQADTLWFDDGTFTSGSCTGKARGARFFADCGDEWLYFNGTTLAALDIAKRRVTDTARYDRAKHQESAKGANVRATIPLGKRSVAIRGVIHLH
jgi:hypothetical protein